jgi:hypothetical protein
MVCAFASSIRGGTKTEEEGEEILLLSKRKLELNLISAV